MEDNKVIVLAILILIISSFNASSITGKATAAYGMGRNSQALASETSLAWFLQDGKGDVNHDGIAFTDADFKDFNLKYNKYEQLKSDHRGYYNPGEMDATSFYAGDVFPAPSYNGDTTGDGSWTNRDLELFRQLVAKVRDKKTDNVRLGKSSLIGQCRTAQVSIVVTIISICMLRNCSRRFSRQCSSCRAKHS